MSDARSHMRANRKPRRRQRPAWANKNATLPLDIGPFSHDICNEQRVPQAKILVQDLGKELRYGNAAKLRKQKTAYNLDIWAVAEWNLAHQAFNILGPDFTGNNAAGADGTTLQTWLRDAETNAAKTSIVFEKCRWLYFFCRERWGSKYREFSPGKLRSVSIPKRNSNKRRTITIANTDDVLVEKAILTIIAPLLEQNLPQNVVGFRKGMGHQVILANLLSATVKKSHFHWVLMDIQDAFGQVDHTLLRPELDKLIPNYNLVNLIMDFQDPRRMPGQHIHNQRGIFQGCALSPALLNVYLAEHLVRHVLAKMPHVTMFIYADDIAIAAKTKQSAENAKQLIVNLLASIGMQLAPGKTHYHDIRREQAAWLGHRIRYVDGKFALDVPEDFAQRLDFSLRPTTFSTGRQRLKQQQPSMEELIQAAEGLLCYYGTCWGVRNIDYWLDKVIAYIPRLTKNRQRLIRQQMKSCALDQWRRWKDRARGKGFEIITGGPRVTKAQQRKSTSVRTHTTTCRSLG